ncbi:hypothetical protein PLICRDRAFT_32215 [Plicaturopsis crispa FD-325 SS-3]|uniref:DUF6532 domain-containing protein n=1 Tax=Plicaturopsis crispa FD-325 SS-3 TaxID=944288 RepID=A0A0C9T574_PLICR|nr:hypothetical protein PLICRDRAFT_32215 [Plicaturopsis crispa FD-325 SS-3]
MPAQPSARNSPPRSSRGRALRPTEKAKFKDINPEDQRGRGRRRSNQENIDPGNRENTGPARADEFTTHTVTPAVKRINVSTPVARSSGGLSRQQVTNQHSTGSSRRRLSPGTAAHLAAMRNPFTRPSSLPRATPSAGLVVAATSGALSHARGSRGNRRDSSQLPGYADAEYEGRSEEDEHEHFANDDEPDGDGEEYETGPADRNGAGDAHNDNDSNIDEPRDYGTYDDDNEMDNDDDMIDEEPPTPSRKRRRSPSPAGTETNAKRPCRASMSSSTKAKRGDFDLVTQEVIALAAKHYDRRLSTDTPFPDKSVELAWAHASWQEACDALEVQLELTKQVIKIIVGEGSHFRGALKYRARPLVEAIYGFRTGGPAAIERNRRLVVALKTKSGFLYKKCPSGNNMGRGYMQNRIIQKLVNIQWFKDRQDIGPIFEDQFEAFPEVALALVFTAVECAIDEWSSGVKSLVTFSGERYHSVYREHLKAIYEFDQRSREHGILSQIKLKLGTNGRIHAKVDMSEPDPSRELPSVALEAAINEFLENGGRLTDSDSEDEED